MADDFQHFHSSELHVRTVETKFFRNCAFYGQPFRRDVKHRINKKRIHLASRRRGSTDQRRWNHKIVLQSVSWTSAQERWRPLNWKLLRRTRGIWSVCHFGFESTDIPTEYWMICHVADVWQCELNEVAPLSEFSRQSLCGIGRQTFTRTRRNQYSVGTWFMGSRFA